MTTNSPIRYSSSSSSSNDKMHVVKRSGHVEPMMFDKISQRIMELSRGLDIDAAYVTMSVINGLVSGMTTSDIDILSAETAYCLSTYSPDYDFLARNIYVSNLHKSTSGSYSQTMENLMNNQNKSGDKNSLLNPDMVNFALKYIDKIQSTLDYSRDYTYSYFALKTLEKSYLLRDSVSRKIFERPQHMLMRVALGMYYPRPEEYKQAEQKGYSIEQMEMEALNKALETYDSLSKKLYTHATPTLFNSGTCYQQNSSCFLLSVDDDLDHIFTTLSRCSRISKFSGGLGLNISGIRCKSSLIRSTNGLSDGIIPMIKLYDQMIKYVNQGGKRNGSLALYIEPWHGDIMEFLSLPLKDGAPDEVRTKNVFTALWIPDIFMKRLSENGMWSLMCPDTVKNLTTTFGEEFEKIYLQAESENKFIRQIPATELWKKVLESQINAGFPFILYKDHINRKSNQSNIGVIRGSNLCTEIVEYTSKDDVAVCNLASISLPSCIKDGKYDYEQLGKITEQLVVNLNRVIDIGYSPIAEAKQTNLKQRAIGIGVQGLQEVLFHLRVPWESEEAKQINLHLFETIYYHAVSKSADLALTEGSYSAFEGSPISKGILQPDMWKVSPITKYDWDGLREKAKKGMRNSLLVALMPTASTAQILSNTESFEAITSNIYSRTVLAGTFPVVNSFLYQDLKKINLWNKEIVDRIITANGSIQHIPEIPEEYKILYKTVWEIPQKVFVNLALDRGAFVDQTQSFNVCIARPTISSLSTLHMYQWIKGAKTSSYYIRSQSATDAIKFTVTNKDAKSKGKKVRKECNDEVCLTCSA